MSVREKKEILLYKGKSIFFICMVVLPLFLLIFPALELSKLSFEVFPGKDTANRISALADKGWKGNSIIEEFAHDANNLVLRYMLKEGAASPLVFITLNIDTARQAVDLSQYESVTLQIREVTAKRVLLFIKTFEPGISLHEPQQAHTLRHNQYILQFSQDKRSYTIKLKDFVTQSWWADVMWVDLAQLPAESFKKVVSFDIQLNQEGADYKLNQPESIIIEKISFHRPMPLPSCVLGLSVLLFYGCAGVYLIIRRLHRGMQQLPEQKPIEVSLHKEKELLRIKEFIETNYHDADISTGLIYQKLGIPQERVFNLLKEEYHLSFKQLIHTMRIREARRLLKETDLRIIDIAMNLGFNNISYFNNIFKRHTGRTPSEYRENA